MRCPLFMTGKYELKPFITVKSVKGRQDLASGISKNHFHPFPL
jgi:hypothetical protein